MQTRDFDILLAASWGTHLLLVSIATASTIKRKSAGHLKPWAPQFLSFVNISNHKKHASNAKIEFIRPNRLIETVWREVYNVTSIKAIKLCIKIYSHLTLPCKKEEINEAFEAMQRGLEKQRVPSRRCSRDPECCLQFVISGEIFEALVAAGCGKIYSHHPISSFAERSEQRAFFIDKKTYKKIECWANLSTETRAIVND